MEKLLKELLNNPRVESITIEHERVGDMEKTNINAKLKEDLGKTTSTN
ncbi:hypothetical protein [Clostridium sp.]|nr:hypothetical protein [Clostridium sp.]MDR3595116.1 hypothetical protein [Clostridium sp.]